MGHIFLMKNELMVFFCSDVYNWELMTENSHSNVEESGDVALNYCFVTMFVGNFMNSIL